MGPPPIPNMLKAIFKKNDGQFIIFGVCKFERKTVKTCSTVDLIKLKTNANPTVTSPQARAIFQYFKSHFD